VDVHLPHLVANAGDVEFLGLEMAGNEFRNRADDVHYGAISLGRKLVKVLDAGDFGDDEEPREQRVILEKDAAAVGPPEFVGACGEAGVEGEGVHGEVWSGQDIPTPDWDCKSQPQR
jgi:hypothetical protein